MTVGGLYILKINVSATIDFKEEDVDTNEWNQLLLKTNTNEEKIRQVISKIVVNDVKKYWLDDNIQDVKVDVKIKEDNYNNK